MINVGKCPKCEQVVRNVNVENVDVKVGMQNRWKGVSFLCPHCKSVLSVGIDPIAIKAEIVEALKGRS